MEPIRREVNGVMISMFKVEWVMSSPVGSCLLHEAIISNGLRQMLGDNSFDVGYGVCRGIDQRLFERLECSIHCS